MAAKEAARTQRLLIDLGATYARFALQDGQHGALRHPRRRAVQQFPGLLQAIGSYLQEVGAAPKAAALAVASPVAGDRVEMTNHNWSFSIAETRLELGLECLFVINDFTAIALGVPRLEPGDAMAIGGGAARSDAPIAVIGPGTGLGASGLVPSQGGWYAIAGEGGHSTLPAANARQAEVIALLRRRFGHVSAERALSGAGIANLYEALSELAGTAAGELTPAEITEQGVAGVDRVAGEAVAMFCAMLGTVAGNLTLMLGAQGGCYIAGGIVPQFRDFFASSEFRARFEAKGRFRDYLAAVPTWLILHEIPALLGLASLLDRELGPIGEAWN